MADDVDLAHENSERYLASAIHGISKTLKIDPYMREALRCEECPEKIPLKRRKAVPWTRLCVDCAEKQERAARGR